LVSQNFESSYGIKAKLQRESLSPKKPSLRTVQHLMLVPVSLPCGDHHTTGITARKLRSVLAIGLHVSITVAHVREPFTASSAS
jgi:hypothetical protein